MVKPKEEEAKPPIFNIPVLSSQNIPAPVQVSQVSQVPDLFLHQNVGDTIKGIEKTVYENYTLFNELSKIMNQSDEELRQKYNQYEILL